jgi:hypothetical protein
MLNLYRQYLPHMAAHQAPLHNALSGRKFKGCHPITWAPELHKAFEEYMASLSGTTLVAHPDPSVPFALVTDTSTFAVGAMLQQSIFSKKFNPAQQKYSTYYPEQLVICETVRHFRHMLEVSSEQLLQYIPYSEVSD